MENKDVIPFFRDDILKNLRVETIFFAKRGLKMVECKRQVVGNHSTGAERLPQVRGDRSRGVERLPQIGGDHSTGEERLPQVVGFQSKGVDGLPHDILLFPA